jgi:hypothetical protein
MLWPAADYIETFRRFPRTFQENSEQQANQYATISFYVPAKHSHSYDLI